MTEATALLRAIHFDLAAANGLLTALLTKGNATVGTTIDAAGEAMMNARKYYDMADELAKEAE